MMTLRQFSMGVESIPTATSWYLADLGEALGKQELFTKQSPQKGQVTVSGKGPAARWRYHSDKNDNSENSGSTS